MTLKHIASSQSLRRAFCARSFHCESRVCANDRVTRPLFSQTKLSQYVHDKTAFRYSHVKVKITEKTSAGYTPITLNLDSNNSRNVKRTDFVSVAPVTLVDKIFPTNLQPYAKLMRLDKSTGTLLLLWPSYWSIGLATAAGSGPSLYYLALFGAGAILMRGAGCTVNDMWDKDIDSKVERTKSRPLASGQLTTTDATFFLAGQLGLSALIIANFDIYSIALGASSLLLVSTYPLMKRYTHWAQLVLGMTFNWGALLGWSVVSGGSLYLPAVLPLYTAGICWTLIYDTIYAHQDKSDDLTAGLKSTAILFGDKTKSWLALFSTGMISSLLVAGITTNQLWPYYAAVGISAAHLTTQIRTLDINDSQNCWERFKQNSQIGLILFVGIALSTALKSKTKEESQAQDLQIAEN